jgi:hypothetical protein
MKKQIRLFLATVLSALALTSLYNVPQVAADTVGTWLHSTFVTRTGATATFNGPVVFKSSVTFSGAANLVYPYPASQVLASGTVITANACGGVKRIQAGAAVTTNTTDTFTAVAGITPPCAMDVVNVGSFTVTLDDNVNFHGAGAADVVLGSSDTIRVIAVTGIGWIQIGGTGNN